MRKVRSFISASGIGNGNAKFMFTPITETVPATRHIAIAIWIEASAPTASITESGPMPPFAAAATSSARSACIGLGAERLRLLQTLGDAVDREDARGPEQARALDGEQADRAEPDHRDRVARTDLGLQRAVVRRRQDVRQQHGLLDAHAFRDLLERVIGARHRDGLGLAARQRRAHAEHARLAALAAHDAAGAARVAEAAADDAGAEHAVARLEVAHRAADLDDLAHELVTDREADVRRREVRVVEVEIGAADRGALHLAARPRARRPASGRAASRSGRRPCRGR